MAKSTYKVVGSQPVAGHAPGSVFEADFSEEQEKALIEGGAIAKSTAKAKEAEE